MSKLTRLRARRSSIAPYVFTVLGLAALCSDATMGQPRPGHALPTRAAVPVDVGRDKTGRDELADEPGVRALRRR